jgi:hypothetical protein
MRDGRPLRQPFMPLKHVVQSAVANIPTCHPANGDVFHVVWQGAVKDMPTGSAAYELRQNHWQFCLLLGD